MKEYYPLSHAQIRIWYNEKIYPCTSFANIALTVRVKGNPDYMILEKAINAVICNNDGLRLKITEAGTDVKQYIKDYNPIKLQILDFSNTNDLESYNQWSDLQTKTPFTLTNSDLFYFALIKFKADEGGFYVKMHHIITDAWAFSLVVNQIAEAYENLIAGLEISYDKKPSYIDYINNENEYINSDRFESNKKFWNAKLETLPELTRFNFNKTSQHDINACRKSFVLTKDHTTEIYRFARGNNISVYLLFLSALSTYLLRTTSQRDIIVGTVFHNRSGRTEKNTVGMFASTVPVRINIDAGMDFTQLIHTLSYELKSLQKNQRYPFNVLMSDLKSRMGPVDNLFNIVLSYQNAKFNMQEHWHFNGCETNALTIHVSDREDCGQLSIEMDYQTNLFSSYDIQVIYDCLITILNDAVKNPKKQLSQLELISLQERNRLLVDFNNTEPRYEVKHTIQELFEIQVSKTPDAIAVECDNYTLTYRELDAKANSIAYLLQQKGVKTGVIVGILMHNSLELIVGIMGVLKAGGAYLPIDPEYPAVRIDYMLEDSNTSVVLTQRLYADMVKGKRLPIYAVIMDDCLYSPDSPKPELIGLLEDLAYLVYTSGTTGKPKGVLIEQKGLLNYILWRNNKYRLSSDDVTLQILSFSFDGFGSNMYSSLLSGGKLVLVGEKRRDFNYVKEIINKKLVTAMSIVPSMYQAILESASRADFQNLRLLVLAGEKCSPHILAVSSEINNNIVLVNEYGPTECSIASTANLGFSQENSSVIGRPISNTRIYIIDKENNILPLGVPGELCISGDRLARGYLNCPEISKQKFIDNPFESGQRMYRTGDIARWLPDGNIEYLGREDCQIKIQGYRIELEEIRSVLLVHEGVKDAGVVAKEEPDGNKYICAFIISDNDPDERELRSFLQKSLPDHMIPSIFICLNKFPVTLNGKIDINALLETELNKYVHKEYVEPGNFIEKELAAVWKEVLNIERVGVKDNFFAMGGDSIKAIQISSRLREKKLGIKVRDLLQNPTIKDVSNFVHVMEEEAQQGLITGEVQLTPIQKWFFEQEFAFPGYWNQAFMLYNEKGFDADIIQRVLSKIVRQHDSLRMVYKNNGSTITQLIRGDDERLFDFEEFDLTEIRYYKKRINEEVNKIQGSIDLENGPLLKTALFKTKKGDHFFIVIHHLVTDGVSWRIFLKDFAVGYKKVSVCDDIRFLDKTCSFKDWAKKLYEYSKCEELAKEKEYWTALAQNELSTLPKDFEANSKKAKYYSTIRLKLSKIMTEQLLTQTNKAYGNEINDILLAALGIAIKEWTGRDKMAINLEGHGREEIFDRTNITRTVGWFTSAFPVILDLHEAESLSHLLKRTKEYMRGIPNKGIGYGILRYLQNDKTGDTKDINIEPEINFNYWGQLDTAPHTGIFSISPITIGNTVSPESEIKYALDINALVQDKCLIVSFQYNIKEYKTETIKTLAMLYLVQLRRIIRHCAGMRDRITTPSDMQYNRFSIKEFENIRGQVKTLFDKKTEIADIYPLSPMQEGMLFHSLIGHGTLSGTYIQQVSFGVKGTFDVELFERSLVSIIKKYDVLRTVFLYKTGERPVQIVLDNLHTKIWFEDVSHLGNKNAEEFICQFKKQDAVMPFDLTAQIPIRVAVIKISGDEYKVVLTFHHAVMDGWSFANVFKDLINVYKSKNYDNTIEERKHTFGNYIFWLEKQDKAGAAKYWRQYLEGYNMQAGIPGKREKAKYGAVEYKSIEFRLDSTLVKRLYRLANSEQVTVNSLIQAIWGVLLGKYNNSEDVLFGAVISERTSDISKAETIVGLLINTIPVRIKYNATESFSKLVKQIQQTNTESSGYSYYPLADIQECSELKGSLVNHLMVFENYPLDKEVVKLLKGKERLDFSINDLEIAEQTNYDFCITIMVYDGISIRLGYDNNIYHSDVIRLLAGHFTMAVEAIVNNPDIVLNDIDIISAEERSLLIKGFNNTTTDYPNDKPAYRMFEEYAQGNATKNALVFNGTKICYGQLNDKASKLAAFLRRKGISQGSIVGIMPCRSIEMMVGILGVMKAGAAFIPIDTEYPEDRIKYMHGDSGMSVLLVSGLKPYIMDFTGEIINLSDEQIYEHEEQYFEASYSLDLPAYIIYTSGSTGKPKGVIITHRSLCNFINGMTDKIEFSPGKTILALTTICFDIFAMETILPLAVGMSVVIADEEQQINPEKLSQLIKQNHVKKLQVTPSRLQMLLNAADSSCFKGLDEILIGGEALNESILENLKKVTDAKIYNMYGPTETTIWSTIKDLTHADNINIGQPIANTRVYILDNNKSLQPIGAAGELYIGGDGLAVGYLNSPLLTEEKFVADNYLPGGRIYKTGDIARRMPDGDIEFLGRVDNQVKIRGYRIEPGEIDSELIKHKSIKEAVVVCKEDKDGNKYLCAYYTKHENEIVQGLKEYLSGKLPSYMIPEYFINIDHIPLTPNNKIDRNALALKDDRMADCTSSGKAPARNTTELILHEIWSEVLGLKNIGVEDSFFDVGGHSLKAVKLSSRINRKFKIEMPVSEIFKSYSIREQAKYVEHASQSINNFIEPADFKDVYAASSVQTRMYVTSRLDEKSTAYNITAVFLIEGRIDIGRLQNAFQRLVDRHEALRTYFELSEGVLFQKIENKPLINLDYIEKCEEDTDNILASFVKPFDLNKAPLLRGELIKLDYDKHLLLIDMHHIISDGATIQILMEDLSQLYINNELPVLPVQYKDFATWENKLIKSGHIEAQRKYWTNRFKDKLPLLSLPADFHRPSVPSFSGDAVSAILDSETSDKVKSLAASSRCTLYMVLLAAYNVLLWKYTGQEDIIVGSPIDCRRNMELEKVAGAFINTIAIRSTPNGHMKFSHFLSEVRTNVIDAFNNRDYPFDELVSELGIDKDISRNPIFDTIFIMQNVRLHQLSLGSTRIKPLDFEKRHLQFDLEMEAIETDDDIVVKYDFNTDLFKRQTIERMIRHYINIIGILSENPGKQLKDIDIISEEEKDQILKNFNGTNIKYPKKRTIQELFELQVQDNPDAEAISGEGKKLSYRILNQAANRLARVLRGKGVRPDEPVGIITKPSPEMIIAILGVLKAGGAFLPIDPQFPKERIKYMLKDSHCNTLIVFGCSADDFCQGKKVIVMDNWETMAESDKNLKPVNSSKDLAYVIYTSGSTGNPKGVAVEHQAVVNFIKGLCDKINFSPQKSILAITSMSFDIFILETILPLIKGMKIVLAGEESRKDPKRLKKLISEYSVDMIQLTPTRMQSLLKNSGDLAYLKSLTEIMIGGEVFPGVLADGLKSLTNARIYNMYGPTETTVWSAVKEVTDGEKLSIGKPIANTRMYIVDHFLNLQPVGIPGELCIAGDGLARCYLNNALMTDMKFIKNPFVQEGKMYRAGDVARWQPDGNIEFIGRLDNQLKILGYRIEPGEIEQCLLKHHAINSCVVTDVGDDWDRRNLVCYYVPGLETTAEEIRAYLAEYLPLYMIPGSFIKLDSIPLTPNGKVDRKALKYIKLEEMKDRTDDNVPRTDIEKRLARIWKDVLRCSNFGIHDNFFASGGNSLLLVQLHEYIEKEYPGVVTLPKMFAYPTIAQMAQLLDSGTGDMAKRLDLKQLPLPREYFVSSEDMRDGMDFISEIDNSLLERIKKIAGDIDAAMYSILLGVFIYNLSDISLQQYVPVQVVFEEDKIISINMELSVVEDFNSLFRIIDTKCKQLEKNSTYAIEDLKSYITEKESNLIIPAFICANTQYSNLARVFDIVLKVVAENKRIRLVWGFNSIRINSKKSKEFIQKFTNTLELIIERMN